MTESEIRERVGRVIRNIDRGIVGQSEGEMQITSELLWLKSNLTWATEQAKKLTREQTDWDGILRTLARND